MKIKVIKIYLVLIGVFSTVFNCSAQSLENFYFKEAQPRFEESLTRFPATLRGLYMSDKDSSKRLHITADSISIEIPMVQFATLKELAIKKYIFRDSVVIKPDKTSLPCLLKHDTVYFADYVQSVIFAVSETHVLKIVDEKFVLSKKISEDKWECLLIYKENDKICIAYFDFDKNIKDIEKNKKIEKKASKEGSYYLANLKTKEFIKLLDKNYFPNKHYFHKRFDWQ